MLDQHHPPEAPGAEGLESLEVLKACCVLETGVEMTRRSKTEYMLEV